MAISDISLTSSMRANLINLQKTADLVGRTQERLASGKKVNSALDDPTSYFAAQGLNASAGDLAALKDSMGQAIQTINAANAGITAITQLIASAKGIAQSALASGSSTDIANYAKQFDTILTQINNLASDSGYRGTNLLQGTTTLTVAFNASGTNSLSMTGQTAAAYGSGGLGLTTANAGASVWATAGGTITSGNMTTALSNLDAASNTLRSMAANLSSGLSIVQTRINFTTDMVSTLQTGADKLTLADMNEEGANMLALQTRQSLSTTALSLSSQANQSILRLFQ